MTTKTIGRPKTNNVTMTIRVTRSTPKLISQEAKKRGISNGRFVEDTIRNRETLEKRIKELETKIEEMIDDNYHAGIERSLSE